MSETAAYSHGGTNLTGHVYRPSTPARAAVILFPTIANFNAPMARRARMLADLGYLVFIADFYGQSPDSPDAARALADALRRDVDHYRDRISAAIAAFRALEEAGGLPLFGIGYCMGGQAVLEAARDAQDFAAAVSFHGLLDTGRPAPRGAIRPRILICHGDADPMVPREQVMRFWEEMDHAGAHWHFHAYSGVRHGFTDPGSDTRGLDAVKYDATADRQSWAAMLSLFNELLGD